MEREWISLPRRKRIPRQESDEENLLQNFNFSFYWMLICRKSTFFWCARIGV
jgi:hypothetical protein